MKPDLDIVIKKGQIVDGTGNPSYRADVGIANGKIAIIADNIPSTSAHRVINAEGLVVCPGFIDAHSHDDLYLLVHGEGEAKKQRFVKI